MALKLAGRNPARFEFDDGVSQTTVTVQPDDDAGTVAAKLRRVLELEGGLRGVLQNARYLPPAAPPETPVFTAADRAAVNTAMTQAQQALSTGWESVDLDKLPER